MGVGLPLKLMVNVFPMGVFEMPSRTAAMTSSMSAPGGVFVGVRARAYHRGAGLFVGVC